MVMPKRQARHGVQRINLCDVEPLQYPFGHHDLPAAAIFLGRLEDQRHTAGKIARFRQIARGTQQHGGMAVMPTGVHLARGARGMGGPGFLDNRQRIHIGAQANCGAIALPADNRHQPVFRNAFMQLINAEFAQTRGHESGGFNRVKAKLGVLVQMAAPCLHIGGIIGDAVGDRHKCS